VKILDAKIILNNVDKESEVIMACGADLMSDVLSYIKPGAMLLTGLVTNQVIYTAEMADIKVICFVRGKSPGKEIIKLAEEKEFTLFTTPLPMFESCGRLYKAGLKGCSEISERQRGNAVI
jgi:hypothetical protein